MINTINLLFHIPCVIIVARGCGGHPVMDLDHKQPWLTSKTFIRRYHFPRVSSKICLSHKEVKTYHFPITMFIQCCLPVHAQLQARDGQPSERSPERLRRRHLSTCCMTILRPASAYCRMTIVTKSLAASGLAAMLRLNMLVSWLSILCPPPYASGRSFVLYCFRHRVHHPCPCMSASLCVSIQAQAGRS